jgi:hypothetical protein
MVVLAKVLTILAAYSVRIQPSIDDGAAAETE